MRILVIEDDEILANNVAAILRRSSYAVDTAFSVSEAKNKITNPDYDLLIIDWKLPDGSGLDLCREIRRDEGTVPILMLTANSQIEDKIEGLDAGADDYLTKPFEVNELLARIRALSRRNVNIAQPMITIADLRIDTNLKKVWRKESEIALSPREYALLEYLASRPCQAVSRTELLAHVWDENVNLFSNTVDVHIRYLRSKIDNPFTPKLIMTVKGEGYALCDH